MKKNNYFFIVLNIVFIIFFGFISLINLTLIIKAYLNPKEIPDFFGYSPLIVLSNSMSPTFNKNDLIIIGDTDISQLSPSDIIAYIIEDTTITHRIIELDNSNFITKGDSNDNADNYQVSSSQIQGKYLGKISYIGGLILFIQSPVGLIVFFVIPIISYIFINYNKEIKKKNAKVLLLEQQLESLKKT